MEFKTQKTTKSVKRLDKKKKNTECERERRDLPGSEVEVELELERGQRKESVKGVII